VSRADRDAATADAEDDALLVAARAHPSAFAELYERHAAQVMSFFVRRTRCAHTAADLTAETFAQAWACRHRFDPTLGRAASWLAGIAGNLHRGWVRRRLAGERAMARCRSAAVTRSEDDLDEVDARVDDRGRRADLTDALAALSPARRDAVVLRVAEQMPYDDLARRLGCTPGAARVRVSRGLAQLVGTQPRGSGSGRSV
jgi:RNA polymerase sigma-70 factor (ECF subfamily)